MGRTNRESPCMLCRATHRTLVKNRSRRFISPISLLPSTRWSLAICDNLRPQFTTSGITRLMPPIRTPGNVFEGLHSRYFQRLLDVLIYAHSIPLVLLFSLILRSIPQRSLLPSLTIAWHFARFILWHSSTFLACFSSTFYSEDGSQIPALLAFDSQHFCPRCSYGDSELDGFVLGVMWLALAFATSPAASLPIAPAACSNTAILRLTPTALPTSATSSRPDASSLS